MNLRQYEDRPKAPNILSCLVVYMYSDRSGLKFGNVWADYTDKLTKNDLNDINTQLNNKFHTDIVIINLIKVEND